MVASGTVPLLVYVCIYDIGCSSCRTAGTLIKRFKSTQIHTATKCLGTTIAAYILRYRLSTSDIIPNHFNFIFCPQKKRIFLGALNAYIGFSLIVPVESRNICIYVYTYVTLWSDYLY